MPTHDHVNIGIGVNEPMSAKSLRAVAEFEYLYTNKAANLFDPQLVADLAGQRAPTARTPTRWPR